VHTHAHACIRTYRHTRGISLPSKRPCRGGGQAVPWSYPAHISWLKKSSAAIPHSTLVRLGHPRDHSRPK
jgi:hypothetical protein